MPRGPKLAWALSAAQRGDNVGFTEGPPKAKPRGRFRVAGLKAVR